MNEGNQIALNRILDDEGAAAIIERVGRYCERRALEHVGGARDSMSAQQRKAWQKAALSLATTAALLRRDV